MEAPGEWGAGVVQVSVGRSDACVPRRAVCVLRNQGCPTGSRTLVPWAGSCCDPHRCSQCHCLWHSPAVLFVAWVARGWGVLCQHYTCVPGRVYVVTCRGDMDGGPMSLQPCPHAWCSTSASGGLGPCHFPAPCGGSQSHPSPSTCPCTQINLHPTAGTDASLSSPSPSNSMHTFPLPISNLISIPSTFYFILPIPNPSHFPFTFSFPSQPPSQSPPHFHYSIPACRSVRSREHAMSALSPVVFNS